MWCERQDCSIPSVGMATAGFIISACKETDSAGVSSSDVGYKSYDSHKWNLLVECQVAVFVLSVHGIHFFHKAMGYNSCELSEIDESSNRAESF